MDQVGIVDAAGHVAAVGLVEGGVEGFAVIADFLKSFGIIR